MDIFSIFTLFGGLAFFLYGMNVMSSGLEKIAGGKLEKTLRAMTSNPFKSLVLGAGITIAIQSSSAMTVMLVGLVNSGIMELGQTVGVIMGSNIGTTLTAWILSLAGIESDNVFIKMLKPESFSPVVAFIGILLIMVAKSDKKKDIGKILVGFSVLMYGMEFMSDAVSPLADSPYFATMLTAFSNPILGVIVGAVFTGIIQSSAASVGILQALSLTGGISYGMAIPIIMGQNIGTCVTALISSIGVNKNAKRVSVVHISFNLIGTIVLLIAYYGIDAAVHFSFTDASINPVGIAFVHSIFNVATTAILIPFSKQLVKIANIVIKNSDKEEVPELLDERLLSTPSIAISHCRELTVDMGNMAKECLMDSIAIINKYNDEIADKIPELEGIIDHYEDKLGSYLVKLSRSSLSVEESHIASNLLHSIGDFERIADHACNLLKVAKEINEKEIVFSPEAQAGIDKITNAISEILSLTMEAFANNDLAVAKKVEPLEQVVDGLKSKLKSMHITRLQNGDCTIETGFVFNDLLTNYERVADHCSNVAVSLIQIADDSFDTHEYLSNIKTQDNVDFNTMYSEFREKYRI